MQHTCLWLQNYSTDTLTEAFEKTSHAFLLRAIDRLGDQTGYTIVDPITKLLVQISARIASVDLGKRTFPAALSPLRMPVTLSGWRTLSSPYSFGAL